MQRLLCLTSCTRLKTIQIFSLHQLSADYNFLFFYLQGKLESYRDTEKSGKELSNEQRLAVAKYDEVMQTLDFAREFHKQILQIATLSEKELKKKQKKDETAKRQNEVNKIREVLLIQDILNLLTDNEIREDFLNGTNGACRLEQKELDVLDKL